MELTKNTLENIIINQDNILYINPNLEDKFTKIYLSKNKLSWITIEWLSDELFNYSKENYKELFNLHPDERGKVIMFDQEITSPRWHRSYLYQPKYNPTRKRSYMYSGLNEYEDLTLPYQFQVYLDFMNKNENLDKFNQIIVNWYKDGNDFIAPHTDCIKDLIPNSEISIITLCEDENNPRELRFKPIKLKNEINDNLYNQVKIKLKNGCIISMYGETQLKFKHSIPKNLNNSTSRISLTFRKYKL